MSPNMPKSHKNQGVTLCKKAYKSYIDPLLAEFRQILHVTWDLPDDLTQMANAMLESTGSKALRSQKTRKQLLIVLIKSKFRINRDRVQSFLDAAARFKRYFDPNTKAKITSLFDRADKRAFTEWANNEQIPQDLNYLFDPATDTEALEYLQGQLEKATINRSDARSGVQEERRQSILRSLFGSWIFCINETKSAMAFNTGLLPEEIEDDYFEHLQRYYPEVLTRSCGAYTIAISACQIQDLRAGKLRAIIFDEIFTAYKQLSNYSYVFVWFIFPRDHMTHGKAWELIHDVTIYAEKFHKIKLVTGYFHPEKISETTERYIKNLDTSRAEFETHQCGFAFRDCIVICSGTVDSNNSVGNIDSVLLLMEKNVADERPIPCPACRSLNIRGNSYQVFGVKSWECQNPLCPERSAFDRGKRFSLSSILRAEASRDPNALIPDDSLTKWKLDVVGKKTDKEILDLIVRHYSLPGDSLTFVNWGKIPTKYCDRLIVKQGFRSLSNKQSDPLPSFEQTPFFNRYLNVATDVTSHLWNKIETNRPWLDLYEGSCLDVLPSIFTKTVDGAVTSPPYYNAREYSKWPNLYCYLYDMKIAAEGVYRVLKPGGYYLFNIFDYFDNDNILVLSAMGKRRLTLGAYMTQIFRRCGFSLVGNIVWYKGEIEGKRNYNQGNRAPFYQLPLNTWEHILILRKPGKVVKNLTFSNVIFCRPVLKWFNGKNRHGHSAPFPKEIPDLLCSQLPPRAKILDPFAGSLTTAVTCHARDQDCVAIELHRPYCDLGLKKIADAEAQLPLYDHSGARV